MPLTTSIDVSAHEFVDWQKVANAGVVLGIAKVFEHVVDPQFPPNWEQIRHAGLLPGAFYFLGGPDLQVPSFAQARLNKLNNGQPEFPVTMASADDATIEAIRKAHTGPPDGMETS